MKVLRMIKLKLKSALTLEWCSHATEDEKNKSYIHGPLNLSGEETWIQPNWVMGSINNPAEPLGSTQLHENIQSQSLLY